MPKAGGFGRGAAVAIDGMAIATRYVDNVAAIVRLRIHFPSGVTGKQRPRFFLLGKHA